MHGLGRLTIALSGLSGSGKSTLAAALAAALGGRTASFGHFVGQLSGATGGAASRRDLQDFGEAAVGADAVKFVEGFLAWTHASAGGILIADGIRHVSVDRELRRWSTTAGRAYVLVHVLADDPVRAQRRTAGNADALREIDSHPVERETVDALPWAADVVVGPGWRIENVVADILEAATADR